MQINPSTLDAIYYGFRLDYQKAYERPTPWSDRLASLVPSTQRENRYAWMKMIPRLREWIGERKLNNLAGRGYTIVNKDWEASLEVDRNDIEDDAIGVYKPGVAMLGEQAKLWPDDLMTTLIQSGTTATAFDGQAYFSGSHPKDSDNTALGTYSNNFTSTALTHSNFQYVRSQMMSYVGEDNKPLRVNPGLALVPPALEGTIKQILNAEYIVATFGANAATGSQTNVLKGTADYLVIPELAGADTTWYLADVSKPVKPFVFQLRKSPQLVSLTDPTSENVFMRKKFIYGVDARGNAGFSLPFLCARCIA